MSFNEPSKLIPLDRRQLLLFLIAFLAGVVVVVSIIFDGSLHTYRYLGNAALSIVAILFIVVGFLEIRKARQRGQSLSWYQQPFIYFGIVLCVIVISSLVNIFLLHHNSP